MMKIPDMGVLMTVVGVLVIVTNMLTELFKSIIPKAPPQIIATTIALILTVCTVLAYISIAGITAEWYIIAGSVVVGFVVSYTAQFGYDKLQEIVKLIGGKK